LTNWIVGFGVTCRAVAGSLTANIANIACWNLTLIVYSIENSALLTSANITDSAQVPNRNILASVVEPVQLARPSSAQHHGEVRS